jgi:hypothetical protein
MLGGEDGQSIINRQLVDEADLLFGVFHSRLGRSTGRSISGTAEEIQRSADAGKPVHVYFADMPHPPNVDPVELAKLNQFRGEMESRGLYGTFVSLDDLAAKVRTALEHDVTELELLNTGTPHPEKAEVLLRARFESDRESYVDSRGKLRHRTRRERVIVHNGGSETAKRLGIEITALGDGEPPQLLEDDEVRPDLLPGADWSFPVLVHAGVASAWNIRMTWEDATGEVRELIQPLSWL